MPLLLSTCPNLTPTPRTRSLVDTQSRGGRMPRIKVEVDGVTYEDDVEPRLLLVHYLRDRLGKVGTPVGCDTTNCGACPVLVDGMAAKRCSVLSGQAHDHAITTTGGLGVGVGCTGAGGTHTRGRSRSPRRRRWLGRGWWRSSGAGTWAGNRGGCRAIGRSPRRGGSPPPRRSRSPRCGTPVSRWPAWW